MIAAARPPLHLTAGEAARHFSLHPEDKGRAVVIVETHVAPCPPEYVEAWRGVGRWEAGYFGGVWPERTIFAADVFEHPPTHATTDRHKDGSGCVRFHMQRGDVLVVTDYEVAPTSGVLDQGDERFVGTLLFAGEFTS